MSGFDEKKYLLDSVPVSPRELIEIAARFDDAYRESFVRTTSSAGRILRRFGHTVEENPEWSE